MPIAFAYKFTGNNTTKESAVFHIEDTICPHNFSPARDNRN